MVDPGSLEAFVEEHRTMASRAFVRPGESRFARWFRYDGDREHVSAVLLVGVFVTLLVLGVIWPVPYQDLMDETTMVQNVFEVLLSGVILLVSIVVSVAAVGASQELTTIGEQEDRVDTAMDYRDRITTQKGAAVTPARTDEFLATLLRSIQARGAELDRLADESADAGVERMVAVLIEDIERNTEELTATLEQVEAGRTDELLVGLDYDASWQLHLTSRLLAEHGDDLSEDDQIALEALADTLRYFMIGREYFKSLYYKREFSALSTTLLTVSLPVIVFISYVLLALDAGRFPQFPALTLSPLAMFISLAYTIALAPYVVLTSYVFRAASVTMRTIGAGPFVHESEAPFSLE